jgi:short-subunit dehydrogenase
LFITFRYRKLVLLARRKEKLDKVAAAIMVKQAKTDVM